MPIAWNCLFPVIGAPIAAVAAPGIAACDHEEPEGLQPTGGPCGLFVRHH